jgi:hypothetical protein
LNPQDGIAYIYRAVLKGNANDFQGCSEDLDHAALLLPNHPDIPILRKNLEAKRGLAPAKSPVDPSKNAEVEKIVEVGELAPDDIHLPGIYVHRIVLNATPEKRIEKRTVTVPANNPAGA